MGLIIESDRTAARTELSAAMMTHLGTFAKVGDPNYAGGTQWPKFSAQSRKTMHFTYPRDGNYDSYAAHQCDFWYAAPPSESLF
jgi:carboxylesterase type B